MRKVPGFRFQNSGYKKFTVSTRVPGKFKTQKSCQAQPAQRTTFRVDEKQGILAFAQKTHGKTGG